MGKENSHLTTQPAPNKTINTTNATSRASVVKADKVDARDNVKTTQVGKDLTSRCAKGLSIIKEHNNSLYALLRSGNAHIEGTNLVVDCRFNFHKERIEEHRNREIVEKVMSRACNQPIGLKCRLVQDNTQPVKEDTELVSSAMAILGGELVDG